MADKLEKDEKARIAAQVEKLGPEGLAKVEKELEEAKAEHDRPIPSDILQSFQVPDVKSISWISVQSVQEGSQIQAPPGRKTDNSQLTEFINADGSKLPFFVQFDHVQVRFPATINGICGG